MPLQVHVRNQMETKIAWGTSDVSNKIQMGIQFNYAFKELHFNGAEEKITELDIKNCHADAWSFIELCTLKHLLKHLDVSPIKSLHIFGYHLLPVGL